MSTISRNDIKEVPWYRGPITKVGDGYVTDGDGWTIACDTTHQNVAVGSTLELWGRGLGYAVRGVAIDGIVQRYATEAEEADRVDRSNAERVRDRIDAYLSEGKAAQDAQYDALPPVLQRRIDSFRRKRLDFRWDGESYEMFIYIEAVKIADAAEGNAAAVDAYTAMPYDEQRKLVDISDQHSGNTWNTAVHVARLLCADPSSLEPEATR